MKKFTVTQKVKTTTRYEKGQLVGRIVSAKIEFQFDESVIQDGLENPAPMTDEELTQYAIDNFVDDIYTMMKYNELHEAVRVEVKG